MGQQMGSSTGDMTLGRIWMYCPSTHRIQKTMCIGPTVPDNHITYMHPLIGARKIHRPVKEELPVIMLRLTLWYADQRMQRYVITELQARMWHHNLNNEL